MDQRFRILENKDNMLPEKGPIICVCHQVGQIEIANAIEKGIDNTKLPGEKLKCGTNCGSCIPEMEKLIRYHSSIDTINKNSLEEITTNH